MPDVFRTIVCTASNRTACRNLISTIYPAQGPTCFLGKRTTLQGGTVATHHMMTGNIPPDMAALFDAGGSGAGLVVESSPDGWMAVDARLGLYPVVETIDL